MIFADRAEAGRVLAGKLRHLAPLDCVVLALPRGGVPVGAEVAKALGAPLDVLVVRKLGLPGFPEVAMGAIASGGARVLDEDRVRELGVPSELVARVERAEAAELARRDALYRGGRPPADLTGRTVVLVDDGLATGATMTAAARAVRRRGPARLVVAVPVAPAGALAAVREEADAVVCADVPPVFHAVGASYEDFAQTTDDEVRRLLEASGK